jgi:GNAT superfamily N-acetyltransferase
MYRHFDVLDASHDVYVAREADGSLSGMTDVSYHPARPDRVQQRFTGVRPDCRGRGIGKWLKAEMLVRIRDAYPQARWVVTENATSNAAMLAINRALGFRAHRAGSTYQIGLETLAERVAGL